MKKLMYIAIIALFASCQKEESHVCYECVVLSYENYEKVVIDKAYICNPKDSMNYINKKTTYLFTNKLGQDIYTEVICK